MPDAIQQLADIPAAPPIPPGKSPEQHAADLIKMIPDPIPEEGEAPEAAPVGVVRADPKVPSNVKEPIAEAEGETPAVEEAPIQTKTELDAQFEEIARQRMAQREQRRRPIAPRADPTQAALAQAVAQLAERLAAPAAEPQKQTQTTLGLNLRTLEAQTGLPQREIYRRLTEELKTGIPAELPRAPANPHDTALQTIQQQLADERAAREELENRLNTAAEEYQQQQQYQAQQNTHLQLSRQFQGYVQQFKDKFPFCAAADPAQVGEALAIGTLNSRDRDLTPEKLIGNLERELKAEALRYQHLLGGGKVETPATVTPKAPNRLPPATPQQTTARAASYAIPSELRGIQGIRDASDAQRVQAAMAQLKMIEVDSE